MASEKGDPSPPPEMVGNAFVQQYYYTLHQSPELVYKFYQDSSVISRPGPDGEMTTVTTMQNINEKIVSLDYKNCKIEILTADTQRSLNDGVFVMVTGCLTEKDNQKRKFSQMFFLAPQQSAFFVLNDIFRYANECADGNLDSDKVVESAPESPTSPDPVETNVDLKSNLSEQNENPPLVEGANGDQAICHVLDNGKESTNEKVLVSDPLVVNKNNDVPAVTETFATNEKVLVSDPLVVNKNNDVPAVTETFATNVLEDTPKKSFASVVNALKDKSAPFHSRVLPVKPAGKPQIPQPPEVSTQKIETVVEKSDPSAVKAYAIFVPNLPMNATVEELEKTFLEFGPIRSNSIQIRSNKGSCFGFVEFESATSMQNALKAAPILFANRKLFIEERRANNDRGRFSSGHGSYRNENYRPRGNFGEGRGIAKHDSGQRQDREFSGRPPGNFEQNGDPNTLRFHGNWEGGRVGEARQRFHQNGEGRVHQNGQRFRK